MARIETTAPADTAKKRIDAIWPPSAHRAARTARAVLGGGAAVGVVLGSGLAGLARLAERPRRIPFSRLPGFPRASVAGHPGELVCGEVGGTRVIFQVGRIHAYEGHPARALRHPVWTLAALGVRTLVLTNAAGGVRRGLLPGSLVLLRDHLNLSGQNPLVGAHDYPGPRFPDLSRVYDPALRSAALRAGRACRIRFAQGVYAGLLGPSYETPAEVRMVRTLGADVVGMSTVGEAIAAAASGMRVLGLSVVANAATDLSPTPLSHEDVLATTRSACRRLERWLPRFLGLLR